jgi:hypothetical protein
VHGVQILNLNDLGNALKPSVIPGETLRVHLIKPGEQPGQGVGYLEDGTMVVVEGGEGAIGSNAELMVTSFMQTSAGRLIFARLAGSGPSPDADEDASVDMPESPATRESDEDAPAPTEPAGQVEGAVEERDEEGTASITPRVGGPLGPHQKKKLPRTPRNPRRL